jgi:hypothetical protein
MHFFGEDGMKVGGGYDETVTPQFKKCSHTSGFRRSVGIFNFQVLLRTAGGLLIKNADRFPGNDSVGSLNRPVTNATLWILLLLLSLAPQPSLDLGLFHKIRLNFLEASQQFSFLQGRVVSPTPSPHPGGPGLCIYIP